MALSNITIVGGAISNFVFNVARRHPSGKRPLIDWDLIMVMEPSTILGALIGGYVNQVLYWKCVSLGGKPVRHQMLSVIDRHGVCAAL